MHKTLATSIRVCHALRGRGPVRHDGTLRIKWIGLLLLLTLLLLAVPARAEPPVLTPDAFRTELQQIYDLGPRAVGQTGHAKIRASIQSELEQLQSQNPSAHLEFRHQYFSAPAPVDVRLDPQGQPLDANATLTLAGQTFHPFAIYPNLLAPSFIPTPGVTGPLVDGRDGSLASLSGKPLKNALVLLDFDSGKNWENAAKFGAAAVLFRHPDATTHGEAARKFFLIPLEMPRFLLSAADTVSIDALLRAAPAPTATLVGGATWKNVETSNILALIPGRDPDPAKARNLLVIQIYLDSMCIAPAAPHGADTSLQLLAGLHLLRTMVTDESARPNCSVLFAFTDAHSQSLLGARNLAYLFWRLRDGSLAKIDEATATADTDLQAISDALAATSDTPVPLTPAATRVLFKRSDEILTRGSIRTARAIQETLRLEGEGPRALQLRQIRDWYADASTEPDITRRLLKLRAGPPAAPDAARDADLRVDITSLRAILTDLFADARRAATIARSESDISHWLLASRKDARIQCLFLDLAPDADQVSWAGPLHFGIQGGSQQFFPNMHAAHLPVAQQIARDLALPQPNPLDDAFSIEATVQRGNFLAPAVGDGNPMQLAGIPSYGLVSINAARSRIDTPNDTPATVDPQKAASTLRFLSAFVPYLAHDLGTLSQGKKSAGAPVNLLGRVVRYDMMAGVSPDDPVENALACYPLAWLDENKEEFRTVAGVRYTALAATNRAGRYAIRMLPGTSAHWHRKDTQLYAFHFAPSGRIDMALDRSSLGTEMLDNTVFRNQRLEEVSAVVAPARAVALFDLTDPRALAPLTTIQVLDATNMGSLPTWSTFVTRDNFGGDDAGGAPLEECGIIFAPPAARIVPILSAGFSGVRATALNLEGGGAPTAAPGKEPLPTGFPVDSTPRIEFTSLVVARDMVRLNETRLATMSKEGMRDILLGKLVAESRTALDAAESAYTQQDYAAANRQAIHAWGVALRAYGPVRNLGKDAVIGSVFFMALCLPFAFFMERLTLRSKRAAFRVLGTVGWFALLFLALLFIHPAFKISLNPMIVLLSFIMLVLVAVVGSIIYGKFTALIRSYRNQLEGVHGADIQRFSASGVALSLALSTMARRRARTTLTVATLTMLAFAIVTFSSINSGLAFRQIPIANLTPAYTGLMFRMPAWADMPRSVVSSFIDEFGTAHTVLPRMWKLRSQDPWALGASGNTTLLATKVSTDRAQIGRGAKLRGVVGVSPDEDTLIDMSTAIAYGTFLRRGHPEDLVLAPPAAASLNITPADLGTPRATVRILDQTFTVVGIMHPDKFSSWQDLDGESYAPVDYAAAGVVGSGQASDQKLESLPTIDVSQHMLHLPFDQIAISSLARTEQLQGSYKAVAVKLAKDSNADDILNRLMRRLRLPVFAGFIRPAPAPSTAGLYESLDKVDPKGFTRLIVPVLLAVFMIVNTLLGTVEERRGEIGMLNSVGLAPAHVGMLFLVEAVVYGVIGLVIGYLGGLFMAKFLLSAPWFISLTGGTAISLNYSSSATIVASVLVLVIVVASALYPASQARKIASPGTRTGWELPDSDTGDFTVEVPFTLTGGNAVGMLGFLDEYFSQHTDPTSPDFRIIHRAMAELPDENNSPEFTLNGRTFIAPYDLGVATAFRVRVRPTTQPNIFRVRFSLTRQAGDMTSYRRAAQRYIDLLRRQFLVWRTLEPPEKQKYIDRALQQLNTAALQKSEL